MSTTKKRKLRAILFADIVGYTSLMQKDEANASILLQKFRNTLNEKVTQHSGEVINNYGDGCLCTFESAVDAMTCAKAVQLIFQEAPNVPVRIGLHSGDVFFEDDNVFGDSVNIASRIESLGVAGAVLFSEPIKRHISNQTEFEVQSLGEFDFKNVEKDMEVFALANEGFVIPKKNEIQGKLKSKKKNWIVPLLIGALLLVGGFGIWKMNSSKGMELTGDAFANQSTPLSKEVRNKRVAVMIFDNKTGSQELEGFGTMITDWITQGLIEIGTPKVVNASDVQRYAKLVTNQEKGSNPTKDLNAEVTIQGRYYLQEDNLIIHASIMDNRTNETIFALDPIIGKKNDVMKLLDQLTQKILGYWMLEKTSFANAPPRYDAYKEYIKYLEHWGVDYEKAGQHMMKAYEMDTTFNLALIRVGVSFNQRGNVEVADSIFQMVKKTKLDLTFYEKTYMDIHEASIHGNSQNFAKNSTKMWERFPSDRIAKLNVAQGQLLLNYLQNAIDLYDEMIDFDNIGDCNICQWNFGRLMRTHLKLGNYDKVIALMDSIKFDINFNLIPETHIAALVRLNKTEELEKAISKYENTRIDDQLIDKRYIYFLIVWEAFLIDQTDILNNYTDKLFALAKNNPDDQFYDLIMGYCNYFKKDFEKAYQHFKKWNDKTLYWKAVQGVCLAKMGKTEKVNEILQTIRNDKGKLRKGSWKFYREAMVQAHLGEKERAVELLNTAFQKGFSFGGSSSYNQDIWLKPLFGYSPFEELVKPK